MPGRKNAKWKKRTKKAKKPDEMNEESLKKGLSNLDEHENPANRLQKMDKKLDDLGLAVSINFILILIMLLYLLFFGGMLL